MNRLPAPILCLLLLSLSPPLASAQFLLKPAQPGELVTLMPSDMAILESPEARKDLPCTITERKPDLGFDLRFHTGYDVTVPMKELAGSGEMLTVVLRIYPQDVPAHPTYLVQHVGVPPISEDVKGDAILQGTFDLGEGKYHIDWLMRDRAERTCSSKWDTEAALAPKDKPISLLLGPNAISETPEEPFVNDTYPRHASDSEGVNLKVLVNFAPQNPESPQLQRSDTDALVSIVKAIERDPHVNRVSLIAFNMEEGRVVYRQETGDGIDFPSLGKAVRTMKLGTVNLLRLGQKHSDTDFLQSLIANEVGTASHPDAIVFAGPKAMLEADVPQNDLRRIGDIECPMFYLNYNLNPQAVPWKDSISHAIHAFKGTEYTISRPRDLWFSTSEMLTRIVRSKREHALITVGNGRSQATPDSEAR